MYFYQPDVRVTSDTQTSWGESSYSVMGPCKVESNVPGTKVPHKSETLKHELENVTLNTQQINKLVRTNTN